jgi:UDP-glucose 4-epimerase
VHGEAGVVAIFCGRLRRGEQLRIFGDGEQTRDYVFVADVVAATLAALEAGGGTYNVGTGKETSVVELLDRIQRVAGTNSEPEFTDARAGEIHRSVLDVSRAAEELSWRATHDLEEGLRQTWAWMQEADA